jgi:hypothetical protein
MDQALAIRRTPLGLIIDPTAKTNGLGFPLANAVSFDSNDKTILWGFCLLGEGECKSAFRFLLNVLLCVYGLFVMTAVPLTTTDGDSNLYGPVDECISCNHLGGATYIMINHLYLLPILLASVTSVFLHIHFYRQALSMPMAPI